MNKPLFITLHGYMSNKEFDLNANTFERLEKTSFGTNIYIAGNVFADKDDSRQPNYQVRESTTEIKTLILNECRMKP